LFTATILVGTSRRADVRMSAKAERRGLTGLRSTRLRAVRLKVRRDPRASSRHEPLKCGRDRLSWVDLGEEVEQANFERVREIDLLEIAYLHQSTFDF